jgi:hypothetical protein
VDGTTLRSCPVVGFGINRVETLSSVIRKLVIATYTVIACHYFHVSGAYIHKTSLDNIYKVGEYTTTNIKGFIKRDLSFSPSTQRLGEPFVFLGRALRI